MAVRSSIGVTRDDDPVRAIHEAAAAARASGGNEAPKAALVISAGAAPADALRTAARESLRGIPIAGMGVAGILTDNGVLIAGAAVLCLFGETLFPSCACGGRAASLRSATERVGRLILSGACDRRHYPRGLALAFARPVAGSCVAEFMRPWRHITGPKLRTIFSATSEEALYGPCSEDPGALTVLTLEGAYESGLGVASGFVPGETVPDATTLVHGAADAAATAVKRLEGHSVRAALIAESAQRHAALGIAARDEWMAMREQIGRDVPCLGWLTRVEFGAGRGLVATTETGSVVVAALGDTPPAPSKPS